MSTYSTDCGGISRDILFFPFLYVYRRNVAQTMYQDYAMTVLRSKTSSSVRKMELLPKTPNGWTFILVILDASLSLVRFKDKRFQIVGKNEQFVFNPCFVYGINNKWEMIATDATRRFYMIHRRRFLTQLLSNCSEVDKICDFIVCLTKYFIKFGYLLIV